MSSSHIPRNVGSEKNASPDFDSSRARRLNALHLEKDAQMQTEKNRPFPIYPWVTVAT